MAKHTYSNPHRFMGFTDWPYGRDLRTSGSFEILTDERRGERAMRLTLNPKTQRWNKPKYSTYGERAVIVEGDDSRTYVLILVTGGSHLNVMQSNLDYQEEVIFPDDPRYADLYAMVTAD